MHFNASEPYTGGTQDPAHNRWGTTLPRKARLRCEAKGIVGLIAVTLCCLPSLTGGIALLFNFLIHRPIEEWGVASSET